MRSAAIEAAKASLSWTRFRPDQRSAERDRICDIFGRGWRERFVIGHWPTIAGL
jgi:hypothetical protein